MNVYVCSTVRHVLFAVLRAAATPEECHKIVLFSDYQSAGLADWNLAALPAQTSVVQLQRGAVRAALAHDWIGRLAYFFALRGWRAPAFFRRALASAVASTNAEAGALWDEQRPPRLWLFNERNKMARVFRQLQPRFELLEEGEGNYTRINVPIWKWPLRALRGLPPRVRLFGEDSRCVAIWVLYPDRLAARLKHKAQRIDFLRGPTAARLLRQLFAAALPEGFGDATVILATQPLELVDGVTVADKQRFYTQLAGNLLERGEQVILKAHPAEPVTDYDFMSAQVTRTRDALPLEVLLLASERRLQVVSVISSAGLGFEDHCVRVKLCAEGTDTAGFGRAVRHWLHNPGELTATLHKRLDATN